MGLGGVSGCRRWGAYRGVGVLAYPYTYIRGLELKRDLMEILACPVCKGGLELRVEVEDGGELVTGLLVWGVGDDGYPIEDSIPNLLPGELRGALG